MIHPFLGVLAAGVWLHTEYNFTFSPWMPRERDQPSGIRQNAPGSLCERVLGSSPGSYRYKEVYFHPFPPCSTKGLSICLVLES